MTEMQTDKKLNTANLTGDGHEAFLAGVDEVSEAIEVAEVSEKKWTLAEVIAWQLEQGGNGGCMGEGVAKAEEEIKRAKLGLNRVLEVRCP